MDANFIMNNIEMCNKEELEEAKQKAKICEEKILEKYSSKGEYKIAKSDKARKYATLLHYHIESISIRYKHYYKEKKFRYVKELDSSTTTVTIDPKYINDTKVTIDSDNDIYVSGYSTGATGKSTVNYNYKTVKQYYYELKVEERYYDKTIMIKNIMPNTRSKLENLEQEFLRDVEKYLFCLQVEQPKEIKNKNALRMVALLEFLVPIFTMILMLVFPLLNTYGINISETDWFTSILSPYFGFLSTVFTKTIFIIFTIFTIVLYVILLYFYSGVYVGVPILENIMEKINVIYFFSFLVFIGNVIFAFCFDIFFLLDIIGYLMILLRNLLWVVDIIFAIYGFFMTIFNGYTKIIDRDNKKIIKRNKEREKIKKEDYPRLQALRTEIAVCQKLI